MCSAGDNAALPALGFPIRESTDQRLFSASPWLIAAVHALRRLLVPRHPPCALTILTVIRPIVTASPQEAGCDRRERPGDTRFQPPLIDGGWCGFCAVFKDRGEASPWPACSRAPRLATGASHGDRQTMPVSQNSTACWRYSRPPPPTLRSRTEGRCRRHVSQARSTC
jgi:hypothetical protein